jgi:predicted alpha/beta-fold hydrolase
MNATHFRPLPFVNNPHLQTVLSLWMKRGRMKGPTRNHYVLLPDGDQLVMHDNTPHGWQVGHPVAVIVHGLTGCYNSGGVVLQAKRLYEHGVRTFRLDLRGAGAGLKLAKGSYHAGCSADVREALHVVAALAPHSPILLAGISLGGNVSLKLAGELTEHPVPNLAKVAALNPPIDLFACTTLIAEPRNRIYERHFVAELVKLAIRRAKRFHQPLPKFTHRMRLRTFDEIYTAPRNGFASVDDYYSRSSSRGLIPRIPIPTLILTARDDPFVAVGPIEEVAHCPNVEVFISDRGGHTGFLGRDGFGGIGWAESRIAEWLISA